jgi:hypothetical protein
LPIEACAIDYYLGKFEFGIHRDLETVKEKLVPTRRLEDTSGGILSIGAVVPVARVI